jgi:hypothetical protein
MRGDKVGEVFKPLHFDRMKQRIFSPTSFPR